MHYALVDKGRGGTLEPIPRVDNDGNNWPLKACLLGRDKRNLMPCYIRSPTAGIIPLGSVAVSAAPLLNERVHTHTDMQRSARNNELKLSNRVT